MRNIFYAQSGGVTAVINASACGVIEAARQAGAKIGTVFAGRNGIIGALSEELIDTSHESDADIAALRHTPGGAFGSCRHKLPDPASDEHVYQRLFDVLRAHDIGYFFYNGGGDSQDTSHKVSQMSQKLGYPLVCIGIPKTVDNDLPLTDNCPGFGSVAKYVATSILEAGLDVASMAETSTKIFIMEVMGRHAGWIAAASGLATQGEGHPPHIILFPEIAFKPEYFLKEVERCVQTYGYCTIVVSEGVRDEKGQFLSETGLHDAFGHAQLGGAAPLLAQLIKNKLGYKYHWALVDYLQRAARHLGSATDVEQSYALGRAAVDFALAGQRDCMLTIERLATPDYQWKIGQVPLSAVAKVEQSLPRDFISPEGYHITDACRRYLEPLIQGEAYPPYEKGLPSYVRLKNQCVTKKLPSFEWSKK